MKVPRRLETVQRAAPVTVAALLFTLGVFIAVSPRMWCPVLAVRLAAAMCALLGAGLAAIMLSESKNGTASASLPPSPPREHASVPRHPPTGVSHITSQDLLKTAAEQKKTIEELRATVQSLEKQLAGMRLQAGLREDGETVYLWSEEYFKRVLQSELWRSRRTQRPMTLLLIDFSAESAQRRGAPSQAHASLDSSVWQYHAQTVCRAVRGGDQVGLIPGGALCVLLPETSPEDAKVAQDRVVKLIRQDLQREKGHQASVVLDTAVVGFPRDGKDLDELVLAGKKTILRAQRDRRIA